MVLVIVILIAIGIQLTDIQRVVQLLILYIMTMDVLKTEMNYETVVATNEILPVAAELFPVTVLIWKDENIMFMKQSVINFFILIKSPVLDGAFFSS